MNREVGQWQDLDGLEYQARGLEERIGKPDLIGSFKQGERPGMNFRMYILGKKRGNSDVHFNDDAFGVGSIPIKSDRIEGVILDSIGLALFSGWMTRDAIVFVKTYSAFGIGNGGATNILYKGQYNEASQSYRGTFTLEGNNGVMPQSSSVIFEIRKPAGK